MYCEDDSHRENHTITTIEKTRPTEVKKIPPGGGGIIVRPRGLIPEYTRALRGSAQAHDNTNTLTGRA